MIQMYSICNHHSEFWKQAGRHIAARLFSDGKDDVAWFLPERTSVDDATAGADTMEELQKLSWEMEEIVFCCGFTFNETIMSRNPVTYPANPKKVLGSFGTQQPKGCKWMLK
jgi:hypothetical protein